MSKKKPTAVIIKGNPARMIGKEMLAERYYQKIKKYLESKGFVVVMDSGDDFTCPPDADVYVAHSRGVGREICIPDHQKDLFAKLGDLDGAVNPNEKEWMEWFFKEENQIQASEQPPEDHFVFSKIHRKEVDRVIRNHNKK